MTRLEAVSTSSTGAISVSYAQSVYIINATGNITYTLPSIVCDGVKFEFARIDNTGNTVTIQIFPGSGNTISIYASATPTSTFVLDVLLDIELVSYQNVWYVLQKNNTIITNSNYFTGSFLSNSGSAGVSFGSGSPVTYFPFLGTASGKIIRAFAIARGDNQPYSTGINLTLDYINSSNVIITIANMTFPLISPTSYTLSYNLTATEISNLPTTSTVLRVLNPASQSTITLNSIVVS